VAMQHFPEMRAMTDGELVRQTLAGRSQAYEELVRRWSARLLGLCHARVGKLGVAEDLAQEALLRGFKALTTLAEPEKFGSWLCSIAVRASLDWLKARERSQIPFSVLGAAGGADSFPDNETDRFATDRAEDISQMMAEVEALPHELREVLMIYYYNDMTYRDLAQVLGVSSATVNARLTKARTMLRERLSDKVGR
jgi:RNA polymerase sigma-70 factor (ECF subfamily)